MQVFNYIFVKLNPQVRCGFKKEAADLLAVSLEPMLMLLNFVMLDKTSTDPPIHVADHSNVTFLNMLCHLHKTSSYSTTTFSGLSLNFP